MRGVRTMARAVRPIDVRILPGQESWSMRRSLDRGRRTTRRPDSRFAFATKHPLRCSAARLSVRPPAREPVMPSRLPPTRREFLADGLVTFALLRTLFARDAFTQKVRPTTDAWIRAVRERCRDLRRRALEPREWQAAVEELFTRVPLEDLLRAIDLDRLTASLDLPDDRAGTRDVEFPALRGLSELPFATRVFGMRRGRAIVPHGHRNMASGHLI